MEPVRVLEFIGAVARTTVTAPADDRPVLMNGAKDLLGGLVRTNLTTYGADPFISQNLGKLLSLCQLLSQPPAGQGNVQEKILPSIEEVLKSLKGARGFGLKLQ